MASVSIVTPNPKKIPAVVFSEKYIFLFILTLLFFVSSLARLLDVVEGEANDAGRLLGE